MHSQPCSLRALPGLHRLDDVVNAGGLNTYEILADRFVQQVESILRSGLTLRYQPEEHNQAFRGSIDFSTSIMRYWARGQRSTQVWIEDDLTPDTTENRLIKAALNRVSGYYRAKSGPAAKKQIARISKAESLFIGINDLTDKQDVGETEVRRLINTLPSHRPEYIPLIWISYLLHSKRGLAVESSSGIEFDTFVVNLAEVFEDYIRAVMEDGFCSSTNKIKIKNGNIDRVRLLGGKNPYHVKPDIYLMSSSGCLLVADAKYKQSVKASDRYEVLAFCEALQCKSAVLISPHTSGPKIESLGTTPSGVNFWRAQINLSADDMSVEEKNLIQNLSGILSGISSAPSEA